MKARSSLKNAALIRSMAHLKTEVIGGIRWDSKANVLTKYSKIKEAFQVLKSTNDSGVFSLQGVGNMLQQYVENYLGVVKKITKKLQQGLSAIQEQ